MPVSKISGYALTISGFAIGLWLRLHVPGETGVAELFHPRRVQLYFSTCSAPGILSKSLYSFRAEIDTFRMFQQLLL